MKRTLLAVAVLAAFATQASAGLTARYLVEGDKIFAEDITYAGANNFGIYAYGSGNAGTFTGQTVSVDVSEEAGWATGVYAGVGGKIASQWTFPKRPVGQRASTQAWEARLSSVNVTRAS